MDLLYKRQQTSGRFGRVAFKTWGKIDLNEEEQALVKKYRFDESLMIDVLEPRLIRNCFILGLIVWFLVYVLFDMRGVPSSASGTLGFFIGAGVAYWRYHSKREKLYVKDLLHGRYFTCHSIIDLARKEAWLETVSIYLRQVVESAKHWDGTEQHQIDPLPKEQAREIMIRGIEVV